MANFTQQEILNALKHFQWNQLSGQKMTLSHVSGIIFIGIWLAGCALTPNIRAEIPVLIINSEGFGWEGPFPKYQFKIYEDGLVVYNGELKVNIIGERRAKIKPSQVNDLINIFMIIYNEFDRYELHGKNKRYLMLDSPISVQLDYQGKKLKFKPGSFADFLLADLNRSASIENWLCPPPNSASHPEYDVYCRDFKKSVNVKERIVKLR